MEELHATKNHQGQDMLSWLGLKNLGPPVLKADLKSRILACSTILINSSSNSTTCFKGDLKILYASVNSGGCLEETGDIWMKVAALPLFFMNYMLYFTA